MKKRFFVFAFLFLFLVSCSGTASLSADRLKTVWRENRTLFDEAVKELEALHRDRFTVRLEAPEEEESEKQSAPSTLSGEEKEEKLVWYVKKSDAHKDLDAPAAEKLLRDFPFDLIYYQTASDSRRTVIFSCGEEKEKKVQGILFSYDGAPCGWWGRKAKLEKNKERWVQIETGADYYFTIALEEGYYYFEKHGTLTA